MSAKDYLIQFRLYEERLQRKYAEVYTSRVMAESATVAFGVDRVQSSPHDRLSDLIARIIDTENDTMDLIEEYLEFREEAIYRLEGMCLLGEKGVNFYRVLHARFVQGLTFECIAELLEYSDRQIYTLYKEALAKFEELYLV